MSFAAIICASRNSADSAGLLRANLDFAGYSLVEYQARQAAEAGATQVVILVGALSPPLSRAVDRLSADGIPVALARDMVTLMRDVPRDRDVLLVGDGMIVSQPYFTAMAQSAGNMLLVADDSRATAGFERIDGQSRWVGLARVGPDLLFGTLDMLGDWDLELTLVRAAVQAGADQIRVGQDDVMEGRVALVDRQAGADLVAGALLTAPRNGNDHEGGVEHYLLDPLARRIAPLLLRNQVPPAQVRTGGIALAAIGLVAVLLKWPAIAFVLLLAALTLSLVADNLAHIARRNVPENWIGLVIPLLALVTILLAAQDAARAVDGLYLVLLLGIAVAGRIRKSFAGGRRWAVFTPGSAILVLLAASIASHFAAGLKVAIILAIAALGHAALYRKLPEN